VTAATTNVEKTNMKSTTKKYLTLTTTAVLAFAGLTAGGGGCATDKSEPKDFFPPADGHRKVNQFTDVQASNGAQEDATLQPLHFRGSRLNSLGQDKLDLIIPDEPDGDVIVYLNLPAGSELTSARHDNVLAYLKAAGIDEEHIKLHDGPNLESTHPAAEDLSRLSKTETGIAGGGEPADPTAAKMSVAK
jgi:hypothetical protein